MEFNDFSRSKKTKCWILTLTDIIEGGFLGSKNSISTRDVMSASHLCTVVEALFFKDWTQSS